VFGEVAAGQGTRLTERFLRALVLAAIVHAEGIRKQTGIPAISHPLGVASIGLEHGADEDEAIAALLHDAVEDGGGPRILGLIHAAFGERVAGIVEACTIPKLPGTTWRKRKEEFLARLQEASASVRLVKASDALHNARAILSEYREMGEGLWARFNGSKLDVLWYYRELVEHFRRSGPRGLSQELDRVVTEIERLASEHVLADAWEVSLAASEAGRSRRLSAGHPRILRESSSRRPKR
jgi:(p)ppGpp synthase/HD superfamily hydrolase